MVQSMMVIAGENTGKKRFMDPKILGNYQLSSSGNFKVLIFLSGKFAKLFVSVFVITEHITDARIDSHKTV